MAESVTEVTILERWNALVKKWTTGEISLTVSGGGTPSAETETIDVRTMSALALTCDHNRTGSDSTDLDIEVFTSFDNVKWDNIAYASMNLGAAKVKSIPVQAGVAYAKVKATNKDASNATKLALALIGQRV